MTTTPGTLQTPSERLDEIFALPDGWYERHSVATTEPAKDMARGILYALTDAGVAQHWGICPRQDGGVSFEQTTLLGTDTSTASYAGWVCDIEASPEGPIWVYFLDMAPNGGTEEHSYGDSFNAVRAALTGLKERS